jgi:hypothetical protein
MFLKTVSRGLQMNSVKVGSHVSPNVFNMLKPLSLRAVFALGKRKMQQRKLDCLNKPG